jgi:hypothetical protein
MKLNFDIIEICSTFVSMKAQVKKGFYYFFFFGRTTGA